MCRSGKMCRANTKLAYLLAMTLARLLPMQSAEVAVHLALAALRPSVLAAMGTLLKLCLVCVHDLDTSLLVRTLFLSLHSRHLLPLPCVGSFSVSVSPVSQSPCPSHPWRRGKVSPPTKWCLPPCQACLPLAPPRSSLRSRGYQERECKLGHWWHFVIESSIYFGQ